jgi:hypothetical protein
MGGELLMPCNIQELTPPLPKEGMLQWWHEVHRKEKGKIVLSSTWLLFWYTLEEWVENIAKVDKPLKVQSTLLRGKHQVQMPMLWEIVGKQI